MSSLNEMAVVYRMVIEDVLGSVKNDFINMGVDEQVLFDLKENWELKLIEAKIFDQDAYRKLFFTKEELSLIPGLNHEPNEEEDVKPEKEAMKEVQKMEHDLNDETLGSDLDDESDEEILLKTPNILICQYDKVTRVKNKWKAFLKTGVASIQGIDFAFNKIAAEFEWH